MTVRGVFTSHSGIVGERGQEFDARVLMNGFGGMAPMLALSAGMPSKKTTQVTFHWVEDQHISGNQKVITGGNTAATTIVVDDPGIWTVNAILMNEVTGEYLRVTAIDDSTSTVTIQRGFAGTTAQTITANDTIQLIGTAYAEGTGRPDAVSQQGETRSNLVQIFKNGWAITGTAKSVGYLTGSKLATNKAQCAAYHAEDLERAFLWGRKHLGVAGGKQLRTSNGIIPQIEEYGGIVESANSGGTAGRLTLKDLMNFLRRVFDRNAKGMPNERIAFCGSQLLELIQQMLMQDGHYTVEESKTEHGLRVFKMNAINGAISLMSHPMMVENALWQRQLYVLHPGLISKRVLRPTWDEEFSPEKQNNDGIDATEGYIAVEQGFEVKGAKTMGIYKNIQTSGPSYP